MSKGSKPRPVNRKKYDQNFDSIKWSTTRSERQRSKPNKRKLQ